MKIALLGVVLGFGILLGGCAESATSAGNPTYVRGTNGGYPDWQIAEAQKENGGILQEAALGNTHATHDIFQMSLDPSLDSVKTYGPTLMLLFRELGPEKFVTAVKQENAETRKAVVGSCQWATPELKRMLHASISR